MQNTQASDSQEEEAGEIPGPPVPGVAIPSKPPNQNKEKPHIQTKPKPLTKEPITQQGQKPVTASKPKKKETKEEEFSEYVPPGYELDMKRKRDKNNRKPCVGDYQPKIIQKIRGFYDMNKTLSRKMFGGESATDMDPFRATARTVQVNRPETHEQEFAERIEQSDNKVRLEHSASKSRSSKSPPKSQRHTNRKQHKSGIGYFENQFPKVRLTSSGGADNQFRRSGSGVVSVNELKTARNTHSTLMRMTTRPQSEQRDEYTLFGERNSEI